MSSARRIIYLCIFTMVLFKGTIGKIAPKIGIIGGGIGGTSCAYFLNNLFGKNAQITLFERDFIGGRLNLIQMDENFYESGGSVIHPTNKHMSQFAKLLDYFSIQTSFCDYNIKILDLSHRQSETSRFGIYDGEKMVFEESTWSVLTVIRLILRYGMSVFHFRQIVKSMLQDFSRIYDAQEAGLAFTTVTGLLEYMNPDFFNMTQESLLVNLKRKGISDLLIKELIQSIMMVNYGQTNNISGFAGFVSLAGADPDLWSVKGGNKLIPEKLLEMSTATVFNCDVVKIALQDNGSLNLTCNATDINFDTIIIAAPLIKNSKNIVFKNFKEDFRSFESAYHQTVATFVQGNLRHSAFNAYSNIDEIFTFNNSLFFNSLGRVHPVDDSKDKSKNIYKIFSQRPLSSDEIATAFTDVKLVKSVDWLAYPHYVPPEHLSSFVMYPGLYYINAIEASASAMEMSAIAAKNIALLVYNLWNNSSKLIDLKKQVYKTEL